MKWAGHAATLRERRGEERSIQGLKGHLRDRHYLEEVGVDSNLIFRRVLKK